MKHNDCKVKYIKIYYSEKGAFLLGNFSVLDYQNTKETN